MVLAARLVLVAPVELTLSTGGEPNVTQAVIESGKKVMVNLPCPLLPLAPSDV